MNLIELFVCAMAFIVGIFAGLCLVMGYVSKHPVDFYESFIKDSLHSSGYYDGLRYKANEEIENVPPVYFHGYPDKE